MARKYQYHGHMAEVVSFCGVEIADAMATIIPGMNIYIPHRAEDILPPLDKLEPAHISELRRAFGGAYIYVSQKRRSPVDFEEILRLRTAGVKVQEIAIAVEATERHVLRMLGEERKRLKKSLAEMRRMIGPKSYPFLRETGGVALCQEQGFCPCRAAFLKDRGCHDSEVASLLGVRVDQVKKVSEVVDTEFSTALARDLNGPGLCKLFALHSASVKLLASPQQKEVTE